ncbi:flagellar basal-body MS-ring/collar protein FliF [Ethanoligenens sp.]|uniref:flagellar basal-body MS-ring/collar protein FliF n=1 Tax=Ethanoligenens sp. TaxID=2099655 RepID=UPI0039E8D4AF
MDAGLKKAMARIKGFWSNLSVKARVLLIVVVAGVIVGAVAADMLLTRTQYELIYSGLSDAESGQIVTDLQTRGFKYKIENNDIYVDKSVADQARMELAVDGYPQTTLNYSIYESGNTWAMTDNDKKMLALYQIQNRLQDTIQTIPGVKNAIVTVTQGNDDTYVLSSDQVPVTASVKLTLANGVTLTQKQVTGIVNIVSHSVSKLTADNVTVIDSDGNTLNNADGSLSGATSDQLTLRAQVENEIKQKVLSVLNPVYGSGNIQVSPAATIDFTATTTNTTTYSGPNNGQGLPSSVSSSVTVSGNGMASSGGTVGVNGAQPNYTTGSQTSDVSGVITQQNNATTFLYNQVQQQVQDKGGSIKNLTIGIILNSANQEIATIDPTQVQQFVAYAVGTTPNNVNVQLTRFASTSSSAGSGHSSSGSGGSVLSNPRNLLIAAAAGVGAVVLILLLIIFLRRGRKHKTAMQEESERLTQQAQAQQQAVESPKAARVPLQLNQKLDEMPPNPVKEQIEEFTDNKPELVAQLLRNWLKDG